MGGQDRADAAGVPGILHVELQARPDAEMGERLAEYAIRLWRRDHLPVRSVVVYLRPTARVTQPPFVIEWSGQQRQRPCRRPSVLSWYSSSSC